MTKYIQDGYSISEIAETLELSASRIYAIWSNAKEKIINYYQYFENEWLYPAKSLNLSNIQILCPIPNIATPMPATTEDGLFFNNFLKNCKELMQENIYSKYFKYYSEIRPLCDFLYYDINGENENTLNSNGCLCGSGTTVIGFLPYNKISICHSFFQG